MPSSYGIHPVIHSEHLAPYIPNSTPITDRPTKSLSRDDFDTLHEFEIEMILGEKQVKRGKNLLPYYRVRWKGYNESGDTWEPERNLKNAPDVLKAWRELNERDLKGIEPLLKKNLTFSPDQANNGVSKEAAITPSKPVSTRHTMDRPANKNEEKHTAMTSRDISSRDDPKRATRQDSFHYDHARPDKNYTLRVIQPVKGASISLSRDTTNYANTKKDVLNHQTASEVDLLMKSEESNGNVINDGDLQSPGPQVRCKNNHADVSNDKKDIPNRSKGSATDRLPKNETSIENSSFKGVPQVPGPRRSLRRTPAIPFSKFR
jgi:hypothetical protein